MCYGKGSEIKAVISMPFFELKLLPLTSTHGRKCVLRSSKIIWFKLEPQKENLSIQKCAVSSEGIIRFRLIL